MTGLVSPLFVILRRLFQDDQGGPATTALDFYSCTYM